MTPPTLVPDHLARIERRLYTQLGGLVVASAGIGMVLGGWQLGLAGAIGFLTAIFYFMLLSAQVRRQLARGRQPNALVMVASLLGRQVICLAAPAFCFFAFGQAWLACVVTLLIGRHWVMVVGWNMHTLAEPQATGA